MIGPRFHLWIPVALALLVPAFRGARCEIIFFEDFENGFTQGWSEHAPTMVITQDRPHTGQHSLRATYEVIEQNNKIEFRPSWVGYPNLEEFYVRYYLYYEQGFEYWHTKMMRLGFWDTSGWWFLNSGWHEPGLCQVFCASSIDQGKAPDWIRYTPGNERWNCFEFHVKLNTPGQADGIIECWVNGVSQLNRRSMDIRDEHNTPVQYLWVVGNYSDGSVGPIGTPIPGGPFFVWLDDFVVATERIGLISEQPSDTPSPVPTTPPTSTPVSGEDSEPPTAEIWVQE